MKLVLNTPGLYLCRRGGGLQNQGNNDKKENGAAKMGQTIIINHAGLTNDAN